MVTFIDIFHIFAQAVLIEFYDFAVPETAGFQGDLISQNNSAVYQFAKFQFEVNQVILLFSFSLYISFKCKNLFSQLSLQLCIFGNNSLVHFILHFVQLCSQSVIAESQHLYCQDSSVCRAVDCYCSYWIAGWHLNSCQKCIQNVQIL